MTCDIFSNDRLEDRVTIVNSSARESVAQLPEDFAAIDFARVEG